MATRQVPTLPQQYSTGFSRESQRDSRTRASLFAGVAAVVYRRSDQTHGKETRGGGHAQDGSGNAGTSAGAAFGFSGRNGAQYRLHRALERDHAPTTRQLDAQVSACGQAFGGAGKRHVAAWLHLQSLLAPSRIEPTGYQGPRGARRSAAHTSDGKWLDRSYLEHPGTVELSRGTCALDGTETTSTTREAGRATRQQAIIVERTITPSALASSSERGLMLNHQLVESYRGNRTQKGRDQLFSAFFTSKGEKPTGVCVSLQTRKYINVSVCCTPCTL
jgi:hypothetical protein